MSLPRSIDCVHWGGVHANGLGYMDAQYCSRRGRIAYVARVSEWRFAESEAVAKVLE